MSTSTTPRLRTRRNVLTVLIGSLSGGVMLALGSWCLVAPRSFAAWIAFAPYNEHLIHDLGAFQMGIGVSVVLALVWDDSLAVALSGFIAAGSVHAINHATDRHLGGHAADAPELAAVAGLAALALAAHLRHSCGTRPDGPPQAAAHQQPTTTADRSAADRSAADRLSAPTVATPRKG